MGTHGAWTPAVLWGLWALFALQFALACRAWLAERGAGMPAARFRLAATGCMLAIATVLAARPGIVGALRPGGGPGARLEQLQRELDWVEGQIEQFETRRTALSQESARLRLALSAEAGPGSAEEATGGNGHAGPQAGGVAPPAPAPRPDPNRRAAAALVALLLIGLVVLAWKGELRTLLPAWWAFARNGRRERAELEKLLAQLTTAVWNEDYRSAREIAARIPEEKLAPLVRLDVLYLRAYAAVQLAADSTAGQEAKRGESALDGAIQDLELVTRIAPRRAEAVYLLALACGITGRHEQALSLFTRAERALGREALPFAHNRSVCLLKLAQQSLSEGRPAEAEDRFAQVIRLGKLADFVVHTRVGIGITLVRTSVQKQDFAAAAARLQELRALGGLAAEQKIHLDAMHAALAARTSLRDNAPERALAEAQRFLDRHLPPDLPPLADDTAEETFSPVLDRDLPLPREIFRGFLFIQAVALARLQARGHAAPGEAQVERLGEPLLRALQIDPRQRDLLGALGGLYYWFRKDRRRQALEWLEAAALMGVSGRIVRRIIERDRMIEMERREALDWFRSASSRFLRDPTLAGEVRRALVEALGRIQEFEPLLIDLAEKPELEPQEPTLAVIRERSLYLSRLVEDLSLRGPAERKAKLAQIQADYAGCLASLEQTTATITQLERRAFSELADTLSL